MDFLFRNCIEYPRQTGRPSNTSSGNNARWRINVDLRCAISRPRAHVPAHVVISIHTFLHISLSLSLASLDRTAWCKMRLDCPISFSRIAHKISQKPGGNFCRCVIIEIIKIYVNMVVYERDAIVAKWLGYWRRY